MSHVFTDPDLIELDKIWPLGRQLIVSELGTIVVAGAYKGRYLHYLSELFPRALLYGYEPQAKPFAELQKRFRGSPRIVLANYGLATANRKMWMDFKDDGSSAVSTTDHGFQTVTMTDAVEVIQSIGTQVDLFVINMEGNEWVLIPHLLDELIHHRIKSLAIQFHPQYVSEQRAEYVLKYLYQYYESSHEGYPDWTYWIRK